MSDRLASGLAALGLDLPEAAAEKLLAFRDLLLKWNQTYNLTAVRDPDQAIAYHLLDALAILPQVASGPLLDVGSGGGLPGLPLAIARPALPVTLVDSVQKKTGFLQQAAIELGLNNVTVTHARVEDLRGQFAQIVSRAFADLGRFVELTRHLLAPGGRWLAMKGLRPADEMAALPADIAVESVLPLAVPGLDAERHLIILSHKTSP
ncbi:MAG: 16S rRNA (guanine(527)-N(7))-methyltransferase RsmG [Azonexus sp.]|jgi:16S rRNA (guanine527-N7)-methyltransferase|nr:16S rRNA (guanine(527)-N(7))-methyltransferase RsmG [Azonexus sp.]